MQTRNRRAFSSIHTEGALLPVELLQRISENDKGLEELHPESYHLAPGEKVNETINRAWNRLTGLWVVFTAARSRLGSNDPGTTVTRERWLLPLFQELGFGRLSTAKAVEIEGKTYPISHVWRAGNSAVPLHLVGCGIELDRRTPGAIGASRSSPHSLMQEYLNRLDDLQWGVVSNGLGLRILRDNATLTRLAYIEFDLETLFDGEIYSDFVIFWLLCHQSRFEIADKQTDSRLEKWSKSAQASGTRALDELRRGVEKSIECFGRCFLQHPANGELRSKLEKGQLSTQDYYRQLLRLVYRLIFLFVAEDRGLLLVPDAAVEARQRFQNYYSTMRLRAVAERQRGSRHHDRYEALRLVMSLLESGSGCAELGIPALGGFLFSARATADLNDAKLDNLALLGAVRWLAFINEGKIRRAVDYRNLGPEELGSVYESLLEMHPRLHTEAGTFELSSAAGNERKTTGSYYTPSSLILVLLDSALDSVIESCLKGKRDAAQQEVALLGLKVCDPACGSGHFLVAAAHRMARRLAQLRTGEGEPAPEATRSALRSVISSCIYGVDINPMSVELCKVSLWMEALEPGKPLSFLDGHIQCGDSLVGVSPNLDISEIPDEAFNPAFGDDKATSTALKKRNKRERGGSHPDKAGQLGFRFEVTHMTSMEDLARWLAERAEQVDAMPEDDSTQVQAKAKAFDDYHATSEYLKNRFELDLWTAAFFWKVPKAEAESMLAPTQQELIQLRNGGELDSRLVERVKEISDHLNFIHWELAFPKVFSGENPGFDCVLGNPPWERPEFHDEKHWEDDPYISGAPSVNVRLERIKEYRNSNDEVLLQRVAKYDNAKHYSNAESKFITNSSRYRLSAVGKYNYYAVFAEHARNLISATGRAGVVIPTGIATDDTTKEFFGDIAATKSLVSLFDLENRNGIFPGVHRSYKFCLFTISGSPVNKSEFQFFATQVEHLKDKSRRFTLNAEEISLFNPNTNTMPVFRTRQDAELTRKIYKSIPVLHNEVTGVKTWNVVPKRIFNMGLPEVISKAVTTDSLATSGKLVAGKLEFTDGNRVRFLPVYEGKMFNFYDHRTASVEFNLNNRVRAAQSVESTLEQLKSPDYFSTPAYWMPDTELKKTLPIENSPTWVVAYKDITASTNDRTMIATILPHASSNFTVRCAFLGKDCVQLAPCFLANLNSIVFDFIARQSVAGLHLSDYIVKQLPFLLPSTYAPADIDFIAPRVLELVYTANDLRPFAEDMGYHGEPFRWDEVRRAQLRAELDAYYAQLYGLTRDELRYILDPKEVHGEDFPGETFRVLKEKEVRLYGEYRTRRLVLEAWDSR